MTTMTQKAGLAPVQAARKYVLAGGGLILLTAVAFTNAQIFGPTVHHTVETVGQVLLAVCVIGRVWCSLYIGGRKNKDLVVAGPYSVVRNPLYVFSFIGALGAGAQSGSIVIALAALLISIVIFAVVVRKEEATLKRLMGEPYIAYMARTPRFIPNPARWQGGAAIQPDLGRVAATFADGLFFVAAIPICEGLEHLQAIGALKAFAGLP